MTPARPPGTDPLLDSGHHGTAIAVDPRLGMVCVGFHAATGRVRALEAATRRVGWEAPPHVVCEPLARTLAIAGGRVYVANGPSLASLDLYTGRPLWQYALEDEVQTGFGRMCLADPYPAGAPGVVVAQLANDTYVAIDRAYGAVRWTLPGAAYFGPFAVSGGVALSAMLGDRLSLLFLDPARGAHPLAALPCPGALMRVAGATVLAGAHDVDGEGNRGVAAVEMPSGRVLLHARAPHDDKRGAPVAVGRYVFSADVLQIAGSPGGPVSPPEMVPGFRVERLEATRHTLVALFAAYDGPARLRLVGFDPSNLGPRYVTDVDLGVLAPVVEGASPVAASGARVAVAGRAGDPAAGERVVLTVLDGDRGHVVWSTTAPGALESLDAPAGMFRLRTDRQTLLYRADAPAPVARYPLEP